MFYVYALLNPLKGGLPFYIGKGTGNRCYTHLTEKKGRGSNLHKLRTIEIIRENGFDIPVVKVADDLSEDEAYDLEEALISSLGRASAGGILTNITENSRPPRFADASVEKQAEWGANISTGNRRAWSDGTRTLTEEITGNLHKGHFSTGHIPWNKDGSSWCAGLSSETDERVRAGAEKRLGSKRSEETRATMSKKMKEVQNLPEVRAKKSAAMRGKPSGMLGKTHSEDTKAKMSESIRRSHTSEEYREKMRKIMQGREYPNRVVSEETRQKMSASLKKVWERRRRGTVSDRPK